MAVRGISAICPGRLVDSENTSGWLVLPQNRNGCTIAESFAGEDRKEHGVAIKD